MAKTLMVQSRSLTHTTNDRRWHVVTMGRPNIEAAAGEASSQITWRNAGVFSKAQVNVTSNGAAVTSHQILRDSGADTSIDITVTSAGTGIFKDFTNTHTIAADDEVNWAWDNGTPNDIIVATGGLVFDADSNRIVRIGSSGALTINNATTLYAPLGVVNSATRQVAEVEFSLAGSLKNLFVYVSANARVNDTTFELADNDVASGVKVTYGSGVTGILEDTSNTATTADGDFWSLKITKGAGTEVMTWVNWAVSHETTSSSWQMTSATNNTVATTPGASTYYAIAGTNAGSSTTETDMRVEVPFAMTASDLKMDVNSNASDGASTLTLMVNGSPSALVATAAASSVGWKEDVTNEVSLAAGDLVSLRYSNAGATGNSGVGAMSMVLTEPAAAAGTASPPRRMMVGLGV